MDCSVNWSKLTEPIGQWATAFINLFNRRSYQVPIKFQTLKRQSSGCIRSEHRNPNIAIWASLSFKTKASENVHWNWLNIVQHEDLQVRTCWLPNANKSSIWSSNGIDVALPSSCSVIFLFLPSSCSCHFLALRLSCSCHRLASPRNRANLTR